MKDEKISQILEFGILNIDKPSGPTSFNVSDFVHKKLGLRKTSHFGTLDPKVTGVLPVALNRACKLTGYFIGHEKEYVGVMRLHGEFDFEKLKKVISEKFVGKIKQTPPVRSRVKRQEREREVKSFGLLEKDGRDVLFRVVCEGGTYIRKLIDDLGRELGVGAHMLELRRTRAGIFSEDEKSFVNLYDFEKAVDEFKRGNENFLRGMVIPADEAVKKVFPVAQIKDENLKQILTGKPIYKKDLIEDKGWKIDEVVAVFCNERFIGMYKVTNEKEIFARPEFVMQPIRN